jgi:hypothetical protein
MGDITGIDLPQATPDENSLIEEKNMARYSKTKEFKRIRNWCQERIRFYQEFLPSGKPITDSDDYTKMGQNWVIANAIILELSSLMNSYDIATEMVEGDIKNG